MNKSLIRKVSTGGAVAAVVLAGSLAATPATAAQTVDPLSIVSEQNLLGTIDSSAPSGVAESTGRSMVEAQSSQDVTVTPITPGATTLDAASQTEVYRGADFGTVTGTGSTGTNASFVVLNNESAPRSYQFEIGDAGTALTLVDGDRVQVTDQSGTVLNYLLPPWARDADGKNLPTSYTVEAGSNIVTQHIDTTGAAFPVTADPSTGCGVGWCSIYFNRAETKAIAAGGATAVGALTAGCALAGSAVAGGACAVASGAIVATAQGANANGNCVGLVGLGVPPLATWGPFVLDKGEVQCT